MTLTPAQAVKALGNASKSIAGEGSEKALAAAGVEAKKVMNRRAVKLSGYGRGSRRGRVEPQARFDPEPGLRIIVEPTKATKGLWAILEHGTDTTWQFPRRRGRQRRAGTYTRRPVHPRHTWTNATPAAANAAFREYHRNIVRSTFRELGRG